MPPHTAIAAICNNYSVTAQGAFYIYGGSYYGAVAPITAPVVDAICRDQNMIFTADGKMYLDKPAARASVGGSTVLLYTAAGLTAPIVAAAQDAATAGYWLVGRDGSVYGYNAPVQGDFRSFHLNAPVVGIAADNATGGYWIVTSDGVVHGFNAPVEQRTSGPGLTSDVIGIAAAPLPSGMPDSF